MNAATNFNDTSRDMLSVVNQTSPLAIEAAFAELPALEVRIDPAVEGVPARYAGETERLVAKIAEQFKAIEQQRARLMQLLHNLDTVCEP